MMNLYKLVLTSILVSLVSACGEDKPSQTTKIVASEGEMLVKKNCKVCHAQGINGAPIIGNKKMWAPRSGKGAQQLTHNAINGFGLMPAKGGNTHLSDEQIGLAVEYMLSQVE